MRRNHAVPWSYSLDLLDFITDWPNSLSRLVDYPNYNSTKSIIPLYDASFRYLANIQKQADWEKNTGQKMAYPTSQYTFGNASNLVNNIQHTARNATYAVGRLSKRL